MAAPTSYTGNSYYTPQWASIYSIEFPEEVWKEWYQIYGQGFKFLDFLTMIGRTGASVANRTFYHYEEASADKVVNIESAINVGAAAANITFQIETTDFVGDATNGYYAPLREHFTVLIPGRYQTTGEDRLYVVTNVSDATVNRVFTCTPLSSDSQIAVQIPASTELMVGPSNFAPGTGQPDGMANGVYRRSHSTQISKESCGFVGGEIARRSYREVMTKGGNPGLFDRGLVETEFRLDRQIDLALFIGETNTNTANLTQTLHFGGTQARLGTQGLWNWMNDLAQLKNYTDTFSMDDFDDIKPLLQTQGLVDSTVLFAYGPTLGLQVENGVLEGMKEWSGGTNLFTNNVFGVAVKGVQKNGINFICKELASFAHPALLGNPSYTFATSGFILPLNNVPVRLGDSQSKISVPNVSIAYYNHNGENRERIIGTVAGLNGLGYDIKTEYDDMEVFMLSEFSLFAANCNQMIQVLKTT